MAQVPREIWLGYEDGPLPEWAFPDKESAMAWRDIRRHLSDLWSQCPPGCPIPEHWKVVRAIRPVATYRTAPPQPDELNGDA